MIDVKIKRLSETATMPTYGSAKAACMDLYANIVAGNVYYPEKCLVLEPHKTLYIGCGFSFQPPEGYCGLIYARSGMASKQGCAPANKVGVCDEDYTGQYIVPLHNHSDETVIISHGDRIAQLMFVPYEQANLILVDELDSTDRNSGGFGSTGK